MTPRIVLDTGLDVVRRASRRFLLVFLVAVGALCGLTVVFFHASLEGAAHVLLHSALGYTGPARWASVILLPTCVAALLALLVPRYSPNAGGGLVLVRSAYAGDPRQLNLQAWLGTFLATPLSLGSGAPLGPEGPTVALTSGLAAGLGRFMALPGRVVKGLIPVGTAAGIAAIFNTPITAVVFALEEVIGTASRGVLGGAIVAAVAAAVVQKNALGGRHLLPAEPAGWNEAPELLGFAFLGLAAGAVAGVLPRMVPVLRSRIDRLVQRCHPHENVARGALAGLVIGLLGLAAPSILGTGYEPVSGWLGAEGDSVTAAVAFLAKLLGVATALAASLVGGVFAPSLFLGASYGAAIGHLLSFLFPTASIDPGAYALVGMGAFFAGFLRTPIASVLIVFELTGDYGLVAPLMLAVALASLVARKVSPHTLVEEQLHAQGVVDSTEDPLARIRVRDAMVDAPVALRADAVDREALQLATESGHGTFPVVDAEGRCVGVVEVEALERAVAETGTESRVRELMREAPVLATPHETLDRLSIRLGTAGETRCPVVESRRRPRLVGFIAPSDMLRARLRAREDSGGHFEPLG